MSDRLARQVNTDLEQLRRLLHTHRALLEKCQEEPPNVNEVPAIAAILHSFYTGVEQIFKRIALESDDGIPQGAYWHSELLERMSKTTPLRPAVVSPQLNEVLQEYMDFRHVFRHAYSFELKWPKIAPLVARLHGTMSELEKEIGQFLKNLNAD